MNAHKASFANFSELKPFYHVPDARLSEGVTYVKETDSLLWVDIYKGLIHKIELSNLENSYEVIQISPETYNEAAVLAHPDPDCKESVGAIFPIVNKNNVISDLLFASKFGIGKTSFDGKQWEYLVLYTSCAEITPQRSQRLRSNDGNVSPCGKYLFVGLMNDFPYEVTNEGCIVRVSLNHRKTVEMFYENIKIPNAIHWDPKGDYTYVTDSLEFVIWRIDNKTNEKVKLIDIKKNNPGVDSPEPDGSAINHASNNLFIAVWSTNKIQEYSLQTGVLLAEYVLPKSTPRVSCCAIVGADLYVTTASGKKPNGPEDTIDTIGGCIYKLPDIVRPPLEESSKKQPQFET